MNLERIEQYVADEEKKKASRIAHLILDVKQYLRSAEGYDKHIKAFMTKLFKAFADRV